MQIITLWKKCNINIPSRYFIMKQIGKFKLEAKLRQLGNFFNWTFQIFKKETVHIKSCICDLIKNI